MATIRPNSEIYLLSCPLESDNEHQLTFRNKTEQYNYFNSLPSIDMTDSTYVRAENAIRFAEEIDKLYQYNYVMYRNTEYSDKWFYAFVTRMEYSNDGMTKIFIQEDSWQTWQFEIKYMTSMIEREHVVNDAIGANTIPEGLDGGSFLVETSKNLNRFSTGITAIMQCSELPSIITEAIPDGVDSSGLMGGVFSGLRYIGCQLSTDEDVANMFALIGMITGSGEVKDNIVSIYLIPTTLVGGTVHCLTKGGGNYFEVIPNSFAPVLEEFKFSRPDGFKYAGKDGSYTPRNNKLYTKPYANMVISNHSGGVAEFNWEDFQNKKDVNFGIMGVPSVGGSYKIYPDYYRNMVFNPNEGLTLGKFPVCSWITDSYVNWLTQASINQKIELQQTWMNSLAGGISGAVSSTLNSGIAGGITNSLNSSLSPLNKAIDNYKESEMASVMPPQVSGNTNCGDGAFGIGIFVEAYAMGIYGERAEIIDQFFDMFGYKVNRVGIPNIATRRNWNYVKTTQMNITGNIPQESVNNIKALFNRGITLWHNPSTFLNYNSDNANV